MPSSELFRKTVSYRKLAGLTRGQRRIVTDDQLIECFESFIRMGNSFLPCNPDAPFIIEELEINPFTFTDYLMVPLDGMCRFRLPANAPAPSHPKNRQPVAPEIHRHHRRFLQTPEFRADHPENIIDSGFDRDKLVIIRDGENDAGRALRAEPPCAS